jgi:hypothetical protein
MKTCIINNMSKVLEVWNSKAVDYVWYKVRVVALFLIFIVFLKK